MTRLVVLLLLALTGNAALSGEDLLPPDKAYLYSVEAGPESSHAALGNPGRVITSIAASSASPARARASRLASHACLRVSARSTSSSARWKSIAGDSRSSFPCSGQPAHRECCSWKFRSQGCADIGICFPPQKWLREIRLPRAVAGAAQRHAICSGLFGRSIGTRGTG